jgi:hypothetical protein
MQEASRIIQLVLCTSQLPTRINEQRGSRIVQHRGSCTLAGLLLSEATCDVVLCMLSCRLLLARAMSHRQPRATRAAGPAWMLATMSVMTRQAITAAAHGNVSCQLLTCCLQLSALLSAGLQCCRTFLRAATLLSILLVLNFLLQTPSLQQLPHVPTNLQ